MYYSLKAFLEFSGTFFHDSKIIYLPVELKLLDLPTNQGHVLKTLQLAGIEVLPSPILRKKDQRYACEINFTTCSTYVLGKRYTLLPKYSIPFTISSFTPALQNVILICFTRIVLFLPWEVGIILCSIVIYFIDVLVCW